MLQTINTIGTRCLYSWSFASAMVWGTLDTITVCTREVNFNESSMCKPFFLLFLRHLNAKKLNSFVERKAFLIGIQIHQFKNCFICWREFKYINLKCRKMWIWWWRWTWTHIVFPYPGQEFFQVIWFDSILNHIFNFNFKCQTLLDC